MEYGGMMGKYIIFPLTEKDRERLQIQSIAEQGTLGICLTAPRVKEGVIRWEKQLRPNPYEHSDVGDSVQTLYLRNANIEESEQRAVAAVTVEKNALMEEIKALEKKVAATTQFAETRINAKAARLQSLQSETEALAKVVENFENRYGKKRHTAALNWLQRCVAWVFRI